MFNPLARDLVSFDGDEIGEEVGRDAGGHHQARLALEQAEERAAQPQPALDEKTRKEDSDWWWKLSNDQIKSPAVSWFHSCTE